VNTNLGFLGMGADVEVEASVLDLKEYAVVLVRLADEDKVALCPSSSESGSGAARFFPLRSFVGSVIERDGTDAEGNVALRVLTLGRQLNGSPQVRSCHAYFLPTRVVSSDVSLDFPLPELPSRERLFLPWVVDLVVRVLSAGTATDRSAESPSLSLACSRSFSFCLAAFTLALERIGFDSIVDADADIDGKKICSDSGGCNGTLELVAS
jgi:hypothetical protein